ncbi:MAG: DUF2878 family protein [Natronospirillum sp.]
MKPWMHAVTYQTTWFITVLLGNIWSLLWAIPLITSIVFRQSFQTTSFVLLVAVLGYSVDVSLQSLGFIQFHNNTAVGPVWLFILWVGFANVIWHLMYKIPFIWLRALLGAISGPLSYYSGALLGAADPMTTQGVVAFAVWWAFGFPAFVALRLHWPRWWNQLTTG